MTARYLIGDVFDGLATLETDSVDLIMSSPPFLALRSYLPADHPDKGKEIGSEATPADFLDTLLDVVEACDRVLAAHGSLVFELGDTYAGGTGWSGIDPMYGERSIVESRGIINRGGKPAADKGKGDPAWPLSKSLCGIPTLFAWSLAYGHNLLRPERETPRWRIRNLIVWARPNPPVGALGDKFRPATSYLTVATKGRARYFDLDAVRGAHKTDPAEYRANGYTKGHPEGVPGNEAMPGNPAGAPPLDYWVLPTQPFSGAHYATWPADLCVKPVKAMCPLRVCRTCGQPSERITENLGMERRLEPPSLGDFADALEVAMRWAEVTLHDVARELGVAESMIRHYLGKTGAANHQLPSIKMWEKLGDLLPFDRGIRDQMRTVPADYETQDRGNRSVPGRLSGGAAPGDLPKVVATGWTDCGHDNWRAGLVCDPFAGSGTTLSVATGHGRDAVGIDLDARNAELALERVGPLLLTVEHLHALGISGGER